MASGTSGRGVESSRNAKFCCDQSDDSVAPLSALPGRFFNIVGEKSPNGSGPKSMLSPSKVEIKLSCLCKDNPFGSSTVFGKDGEKGE